MTILSTGTAMAFEEIPAFSIVVYREVFYETIAFQSLIASLQHESSGSINPHIFIYDNTDIDEWNIAFDHLPNTGCINYYHNKLNAGISIAYNFLASKAAALGIKWIVFMDQDTMLPATAVRQYLNAITSNPNVLLKAPVLMVGKNIFSPSRLVLKKTVMLKKMLPGIFDLKKYAIVNSGMLVNLSLFFKAGGYDEKVKLDFADFLFIDRLRKHISSFEVLPLTCYHDFSHNESNIEKALSRYKIFMKDLANCPRNNLSDSVGYFLLGLMHLGKLTLKFRSLKFVRLHI